MAEKKVRSVHQAGKRKMACARTTINEGRGVVRINSAPLEIWGDELVRMRVMEPLMLAKDFIDLDKVDMTISVYGGGLSGQTDAIRTSIARALIDYPSKNRDALRDALVRYDRTLVAGDSRRTEPHKPSKSSKGPRAKRQKSYR
jgi:small subunit ribosomal protein S9